MYVVYLLSYCKYRAHQWNVDGVCWGRQLGCYASNTTLALWRLMCMEVRI